MKTVSIRSSKWANKIKLAVTAIKTEIDDCILRWIMHKNEFKIPTTRRIYAIHIILRYFNSILFVFLSKVTFLSFQRQCVLLIKYLYRLIWFICSYFQTNEASHSVPLFQTPKKKIQLYCKWLLDNENDDNDYVTC